LRAAISVSFSLARIMRMVDVVAASLASIAVFKASVNRARSSMGVILQS
jgi:hypothetical protein